MNWLIWSLLDIVKNLLTSFTHWPVILSYTVIDLLFCCLQRSEQDSESVEAFNPHLSYVYKDRSVIEDAASLILHHMKRQAGQLHHHHHYKQQTPPTPSTTTINHSNTQNHHI